MLDQPQYIKGIISTVSRDPDPGTITAICTVCHTLMAHNKLLVHKTRYNIEFQLPFVLVQICVINVALIQFHGTKWLENLISVR